MAKVRDEAIPREELGPDASKSVVAAQALLERAIQAKWVDMESRARGIKISNAAAAARLERLFGDTSDTPKKELHILVHVQRRTMLQRQLARKVLHRPFVVRPDAIKKYYERHKTSMVISASRRIRIVTTRSETDARAARRALERGDSWAKVVKRYSADRERRRTGLTDMGLVHGDYLTPLAKEVFRSPKGRLVGPVESDGAWSVFQVFVVSPEFRLKLNQARPRILPALKVEQEKRALAAMFNRLSAKYRKVTVCAHFLRVPECRNSPTSKMTIIPLGRPPGSDS